MARLDAPYLINNNKGCVVAEVRREGPGNKPVAACPVVGYLRYVRNLVGDRHIQMLYKTCLLSLSLPEVRSKNERNHVHHYQKSQNILCVSLFPMQLSFATTASPPPTKRIHCHSITCSDTCCRDNGGGPSSHPTPTPTRPSTANRVAGHLHDFTHSFLATTTRTRRLNHHFVQTEACSVMHEHG